MNPNPTKIGAHFRNAGLLILILSGVLLYLFAGAVPPDRTVFSNDGPLGSISARWGDLPSAFFGVWQDLNWLGTSAPSGLPDLTLTLCLLFGKLGFSKVFAPFSLFFLGMCAWFCFRSWKFSPAASVLGALAAALNGDFFSTACWGVAAQPIAFGCNFLAIGVLADSSSSRSWARVALGGFAVGMGVMEAYDIGAIFSLFTAAFLLYRAWLLRTSSPRWFLSGFVKLGIVAVCAAFIAMAALMTLVGTQIKGIAGLEPGQETSQQQWDWATQWSLPKREILDVMLPGIYGFRMDSPKGGKYWGAGGRDPSWDRYFESGKQGPPPQGAPRFSGGGHYAGALVLLGAAWAIFQSLRKRNSAFSDEQRKMIWFWAGVTVVAVLLAFGRFAPFYQFFYMIPYASTIRNPAKFIHVFEWALVILFAYGSHGLSTACLSGSGAAPPAGPVTHFKSWWSKVQGFDRSWVRGTAIFLGLLLLGWLGYAQSHDSLIRYLQEVAIDPAEAPSVASFSIRQPGWFILFFSGAAAIVTLMISGYFAGRRRTVAGVLLGVVLVADLARANMPWVVTYNWKEKYATDPVVELLRQNAFQHRVTVFPLDRFLRLDTLPPEYRPLIRSYSQLRSFYQVEWMQHHFQYYNIQSLDVVQMPRVPADYQAFASAVMSSPFRYWQLTNTRYLLGPISLLDLLNEGSSPTNQPFRTILQFDIVPKPGVTEVTSYGDLRAVANTNGQYAVFESANALPRAMLFGNWQVSTNDQATLRTLGSTNFIPSQTVLVANPIPGPSGSGAAPGAVEFSSYAPKHLVLKTRAAADSVLLLNDKYDPNWQASLDGKPVPLLRCNFIMRGVQVPAGDHTVEFRFAPSLTGLYVSLGAVAIGLLLAGFLLFTGDPKDKPPQA